MEAKKQLGAEVVKIYYGEEAAKEARDWFENVFSKRNLDVDLPEVEVRSTEVMQSSELVEINTST